MVCWKNLRSNHLGFSWQCQGSTIAMGNGHLTCQIGLITIPNYFQRNSDCQKIASDVNQPLRFVLGKKSSLNKPPPEAWHRGHPQITLLKLTISPCKGNFWRWNFPFPKVGYVIVPFSKGGICERSLEGIWKNNGSWLDCSSHEFPQLHFRLRRSEPWDEDRTKKRSPGCFLKNPGPKKNGSVCVS